MLAKTNSIILPLEASHQNKLEDISAFIIAISALEEEEHIPAYLFESGFDQLHSLINSAETLNKILNGIHLGQKRS